MALKPSEIEFLFELTADAYSRDRYTDAGWRGSIQKMARAGYSSRQIEAVLRSKHMRWAADNAGRNGSTTAANFEAYWTKTYGGFNTPRAARNRLHSAIKTLGLRSLIEQRVDAPAEVREQASLVTASNDEDGVAQALSALVQDRA